ncbi:hypothetical protein [Paucibacter soli]|uniref:hypothetical protein n=1 Tax=Paucibacter soli TaxID=3133433 RepID=UPI0030B2BF4A
MLSTRYRFELILALVFALLWGGVWLWQNPHRPIKPAEAEQFIADTEKLPFPPEERAEMRQALRAWMAADDGKPVYMLNLMRNYPELRRYQGSLATNQFTPAQSNAHYEDAVAPLLLKVGGYPLYAGQAQGKNLLVHEAGLDDWSRVIVVRYPSRRAFMELVTDPAYRTIAPYKLMALKVLLAPTGFQLAIPELSWLLGALLSIVWLLAAWRRAVRA